MSSLVEHVVLCDLVKGKPRVTRVFGEAVVPPFLADFCFPASLHGRIPTRDLAPWSYPFVLTDADGKRLYCVTYVEQQR